MKYGWLTSLRLSIVLVPLTTLALSGCGPDITFISSARPPGAEPLAMRGEKVVAVVMMHDEKKRQQAEDTLARAITKYGAQGLAMYRILPSDAPSDEAAARAALEAAQVKGVVVLRPRRAEKTVVTPPGVYSSPMYSDYWGGYYPLGWGNAWGAPVSMVGSKPLAWNEPGRPEHAGEYYQFMPYSMTSYEVAGSTKTYDVVRVEALIYSLKQNRLVWAGETESTAPGNVESYVLELADKIVEQLRDVRLI